MNKLLYLVFFFLFSGFSYCQNPTKLDSLIKVLGNEKNDTNKIKTINNIASELSFINPRESLKYAEQQLKIAKILGWKKGISDAYYNIGNANYALGNFSTTLAYWMKDLKQREELHDTINTSKSMVNIGSVYQDLGDYKRALEYDIKALKLAEKIGDKKNIVLEIGRAHV